MSNRWFITVSKFPYSAGDAPADEVTVPAPLEEATLAANLVGIGIVQRETNDDWKYTATLLPSQEEYVNLQGYMRLDVALPECAIIIEVEME